MALYTGKFRYHDNCPVVAGKLSYHDNCPVVTGNW